MNKKAQQLKIAKAILAQGKKELNAFKESLNEDPMRALEWFTTALIGTCKHDVGTRCVLWVEGDGDLRTLANMEIKRIAGNVIRSTGVLDLEIKQYMLREWQDVLSELDVQDIPPRDKVTK